MAGDFKDLFSERPDAYARYRPSYPAALFAWLAAQAPGTKLAVDVGTGSGQGAGQGHQRVEVAGRGLDGEQDSHGGLPFRDCGTITYAEHTVAYGGSECQPM